ncbi:MAG: putative cytochrome c-type [Actinobacteria bacterium]|nr:MAG: putative cytochrome c-type [Actinomycetota bacterium]MDO8950830.1 cytochrome c3 family protein [Actinomycetota bacterium]
MAKISLSGFKDPVRRPRYIIWTGVVVLVLAVFVFVAFSATSTYWFCAEVCHKVQDDSIDAYNRSAHNMVSCMSCHEPVNADPITLTLKKAKALGELVLTVTGNYELPLNAESHLAMNAEEMGSGQCTQCHTSNRVITPGAGIIIDHAVHEENEVSCTVCHNRAGHNESGDWNPKLSNPNGGEKSVKHANFMSMTACFRCHTLTNKAPKGGIKAPGTCSACHPANFKLKPANHEAKDFYPKGHARLAAAKVDRATGKPVQTTDAASEATGAAEGAAEGTATETAVEGEGLNLLAVSAIDYCSTCHVVDTFCSGCHGLEMPHPASFAKNHGADGKAKPKVCANCHAKSKGSTGTEFCNACHHKQGDPNKPWIPQHFVAVRETGAQACFECHAPTSCAKCHVRAALP